MARQSGGMTGEVTFLTNTTETEKERERGREREGGR